MAYFVYQYRVERRRCNSDGGRHQTGSITGSGTRSVDRRVIDGDDAAAADDDDDDDDDADDNVDDDDDEVEVLRMNVLV